MIKYIKSFKISKNMIKVLYFDKNCLAVDCICAKM